MSAGSELEVSLPQTALEITILLNFDVSPDANTFLVFTENATPVTRVNVILNWLDELNARVPLD